MMNGFDPTRDEQDAVDGLLLNSSFSWNRQNGNNGSTLSNNASKKVLPSPPVSTIPIFDSSNTKLYFDNSDTSSLKLDELKQSTQETQKDANNSSDMDTKTNTQPKKQKGKKTPKKNYANPMIRAHEIVSRYRERGNVLPRLLSSNLNDPDRRQEHKDAKRIYDWKQAVRGIGKSKCSPEVKAYLDANMPNWNESGSRVQASKAKKQPDNAAARNGNAGSNKRKRQEMAPAPPGTDMQIIPQQQPPGQYDPMPSAPPDLLHQQSDSQFGVAEICEIPTLNESGDALPAIIGMSTGVGGQSHGQDIPIIVDSTMPSRQGSEHDPLLISSDPRFLGSELINYNKHNSNMNGDLGEDDFVVPANNSAEQFKPDVKDAASEWI